MGTTNLTNLTTIKSLATTHQLTESMNLERKMILQEETEKTEDEEIMQNASFTRKVKEIRPGFRRNPLNLC